MEVKLFEIRDRATFIPAMAVRLRNRTPEEFFLLRRAGYSREQISGPEETPGQLAHGLEPYVILVKLDGVESNYDPFGWRNYRTMGNAHSHIIANWHKLQSGDVVDVEYILGETSVKKRSEQAGETNIVRSLEETDQITP